MRLFGPSYHAITDQLYVGGKLIPDEWSILAAEGITVDMDLQEEAQDRFEGARPDIYLWLPFEDWTGPDPATIYTGVRFLRLIVDERRKVYVHCYAGVGRSVIMAAGYLVSSGLSSDGAFPCQRETPADRPPRPADPVSTRVRAAVAASAPVRGSRLCQPLSIPSKLNTRAAY